MPDPAKLRSTGPLAGGDVTVLEPCVLESGAAVFAPFAGVGADEELVVAFEELVVVFAAPVELVCTVTVDAAIELAGVLACVEPLEPSPQPGSTTVASSASSASAAGTPIPLKRLCSNKLIKRHPSGESIGSTG